MTDAILEQAEVQRFLEKTQCRTAEQTHARMALRTAHDDASSPLRALANQAMTGIRQVLTVRMLFVGLGDPGFYPSALGTIGPRGHGVGIMSRKRFPGHSPGRSSSWVGHRGVDAIAPPMPL
ncbi:MAG TPA: hypothetical protein PKL73_23465 [Polyangiaceae bacterium]|jgi:hypothetical protein|nr:MAG: hypothetical protein BWY17_00253 [Deltaproteobacteria bacterium ADurb.Bin207]HNS99937.1 hypothetical protein [Polyangiaceae bacterium]HNZ22253.1 hypothetical protein [Polyangiaceae bacterium]HOG99922.1 hypothetical protein [Polyangiaceae bacterium]